MLIGPLARWIVGVGDVKGRGERPVTFSVHQEGDVLGVIVKVCRHDIEDHPAKLLGGLLLAHA